MSVNDSCKRAGDAAYGHSLDGSIWTRRRRELLDFFCREASSLAAAYEGAIALLHNAKFPGRVHLICHVMRDILNTLPSILDGVKRQGPGEVYPPLIKNISGNWTEREFTVNTDGGSVTITAIACDAIRALLKKHDELEKQETTGALLTRALYRRSENSGISLSPNLVDSFQKSRKWFVKRAHLNSEPSELPPDDELRRQVESLEAALHSFVGQYFSGTADLDEILRSTNP
jgi:hypothetical protein